MNQSATAPRAPRIGMIVPSSNTCLEPVTSRILESSGMPATAHYTRVPVTRIALDSGADAQFDTAPMRDAAGLLADARVDVIAWNGTSGSWLGPDRDRALRDTLEQHTGIPATTSTLALLAACHAYGVTRLGLAVPYTGDVTERIVRQYAREGVHCPATDSLGISDNESFARVPAARVADQLDAVTRADEVHAAAVVCTNVYGAPLAAEAEAKLGVPVLDSVSATVWHALQLLGSQTELTGWGELLRHGSLRARFQHVLDELRAATGADRTTLRLDLPEAGLGVDLTAAESLGDGVRSIRRDSSLDQRALHTVRWLDRHRRPLVQPHFRGDPQPPQALIGTYGVTAQMLGPLAGGSGPLRGWISVHSLAERDWTAADTAALTTATARVGALLGD